MTNLLLSILLVASWGCTTSPSTAGDGLETRIAELEGRLDDSESSLAETRADTDHLAGIVSILQEHPTVLIEAVEHPPALAEAVCPNAAVLAGGGCACLGTNSLVRRSHPVHIGCTANDESCVRSWLCECSNSQPGTAFALCVTVPD